MLETVHKRIKIKEIMVLGDYSLAGAGVCIWLFVHELQQENTSLLFRNWLSNNGTSSLIARVKLAPCTKKIPNFFSATNKKQTEAVTDY